MRCKKRSVVLVRDFTKCKLTVKFARRNYYCYQCVSADDVGENKKTYRMERDVHVCMILDGILSCRGKELSQEGFGILWESF